MKATVAILDKRGKSVIPKIVGALSKILPEEKVAFTLVTPTKRISGQIADWLNGQEEELASVAIGSASTNSARSQTQIIKIQDAYMLFDGRIYSPVLKGSIAELFGGKVPYDYIKAADILLEKIDGDFYIITEKIKEIWGIRDLLGVQPLYFGENETLIAMASNRKILWNLGISEPKSFPPGHIGVGTKQGFTFTPIQTLTFAKPMAISMDEAAKELEHLLTSSVQRRVSDQKKIAVAFSGGIDSSIIAYLAKQCGAEVELFHVSLQRQLEIGEARKAADLLGLKLKVHQFTELELESAIPKVIELVEEADPVKIGVGVSFYWNAQIASKSGHNVLLAGQGADELFGGYQRYLTQYLKEGDEKVRRTMFDDVAMIYESNIERDEKICIAFDVELRLPFASFGIAKFALSLPTELKFERKTDSLRKLVLRKMALRLELPREITTKPKKAVQYSTGINNALKKLAKKENLTTAEYTKQIFIEMKQKENLWKRTLKK